MPPLGPFDYIVLLVIVITLVEAIIEFKYKRWWRGAVALLFMGVFIYLGRAIFIWCGQNWFGIP